jgi:hypothetical protein
MTPPVLTSTRRAEIVFIMKQRAEEGCTGVLDFVCCDRDFDVHPKDWCNRCLMGVIARDLLSVVDAQIPTQEEQQETRVDDSQYGGPLATAGSNKQAPSKERA